jgi:hypothetical protein
LDKYGRRVLWVPPDDRAVLCASHGKKVVMGTSNRGRVYVVDFSAVPLL